MTDIFLPFAELSPEQLMDVYSLRQRVFVIEQACFYEDIDGSDPIASHLLIYDEDILCAYLRFFEPGVKFAEACLGRIVVDREYRGKNTGRNLVECGIKHSKKHFPDSPIRIEAQAALIEYYKTCGFEEEGSIYLVDDISHIQMVLT